MQDLKNKVVLITGGARGMGRLDALNFAAEGARVVITDVDEKALSETVNELKEKGHEIHAYNHDVSDRADCFAVAVKVKKEVGPIDVLINNAGITRSKKLLDFSEVEFCRINDVNYLGTVWMMQAIVPDMVKRGSGHVVNMCSVAGKMGVPFLAPYCGSKAASIVVTDCIRNETRGSGVNFTIVDPYFVSTGMFAGAKNILVAAWQKPENISAAVIDAVKNNRGEICRPRLVIRVASVVRALSFPKLSDFGFRLLGGHRVAVTCKDDKSRAF